MILAFFLSLQPILANDVELQLAIEDGTLELEWANRSEKSVNLIVSFDTPRGTHYDPYQLYFVSDMDEVTVLRFGTWAVSSSPNFVEISPDERLFLKIDLEKWIKEKTEFGYEMPEDWSYLAFVRYRKTAFHNDLPELKYGSRLA